MTQLNTIHQLAQANPADQTGYALVVTLVLFLVIIATRALPFVFSRVLKHSQALQEIGKSLPAYIMMLLVIFEIKITSFTSAPYGLPAIIALVLLTLAHLWKRTMLLSIIVGTASFILASYVLQS